MTAVATRVVAPLDPLRTAPGGRYDDGVVTVVATPGGRPSVRATAAGGCLEVRHTFTVVDDDLAELLGAALDPVTADPDVFARAFVGVVLTTGLEPTDAWERFYRSSLARLADDGRTGYVEIYRHALDLLPRTSVLDLGAGFGFLALHLAESGADVRATDCDAGALRLLTTMSGRLRVPVRVMRALEAVSLPDAAVDAVALVHVLEHVDDETGRGLLREALRVARDRVVVAVPYEDVPTALYGHVRTFDATALITLGRLAERAGWHAEVHGHHGGWLVLDHPDRPLDRPCRPSPAPAGGPLLPEGDPS